MRTLVNASAFCALIMLPALPASAQMMGGHTPPVPMTVQQFSAAQVGQNVQIAVHVDQVKRSTVYAEVLVHETETVSSLSGHKVQLYFQDDTPVIMGTSKDVVPGAVLYVYGVLTSPGHVDVKRLVVDSKYVKVQ